MSAQKLATAVVFTVASLLSLSASEAAQLLVHFDMEQDAAPLADTVSGLTAEERAGGHLYRQPGPPGFGSAVGLTERGAWILDVDESAQLRDLVNNFTVAAWVYVDSEIGADKPPEATAGVNRIMGDADVWDADGWAWGIHNDGRILFTKNGIIDAWSLDGVVNLDEWTHVAVTVSFDDGLTYYVNGSEVDNIGSFDDLNPSPGNNGRDDFWGIAQANTPTNEQWFAGLLDEVRVYSDLLTPEEIAALLVPSRLVGDFNGDGVLDVGDVNALSTHIASGGRDPLFDANADNAVDARDLTTWVKDLKKTWLGDANLDGEFNSSDFVAVFQAGKFERDVDAGWQEGDWTADLRFSSSDFVAAFQDGGFERGPRAAARAVPEPSGILLVALLLASIGSWHRRRD